MVNVPNEADRLRAAGRSKILRTGLLFGGPLLAILVAAGLQFAGTIHLEEYLAVPPEKLDRRVVWQLLAGLASFQFLLVALGVLQGWGGIRRANQLRRQSGPGGSEGVSREAR